MDSDGDYSDSLTLPDISPEARNATLHLLPTKSKHLYEKRYDMFMDWCKKKGTTNVSENVMLVYLSEQAKVCSPAYLWTIYSMLKATIQVKNDINISCFTKVVEFLKRSNVGYKPKKSKVFTINEVKDFLQSAPDEQFLLNKVVLIFGITGACRIDELLKITVNDVVDEGTHLVVTIPDSKTNKGRVFPVTNIHADMDFLSFYRKYLSLRPKTRTSPRLFIGYRNGKCVNVVVGKNSLAKIPKEIAEYLNLPNPNFYSGRCLRRTSATLLVDGGETMTQLKHHGNRRSSTLAIGLSCCALECSNTSDSWVMTVLPQDPDLRQQWLDKIARNDWTPDENSALCEMHFSEEMWEQDIGGEKLLKPDAVPSLFLPRENKTEINEENFLCKPGTSDQSMERDESIDIEEHPVFIKQEILDQDSEMFDEEDNNSPSESDKFLAGSTFETVYCNSEGIVSKKIKREIEEQESGCLENVGESTIIPPKWKCLVPECQEMFNSEEQMNAHMKRFHKNTEEALELKRKESLETKSQKEVRELLKTSVAPLVLSGIKAKFPKASPMTPVIPSFPSTLTNVDSSISDPRGPKQFLLFVPQQSGNAAAKVQAPLPPPQPPTTLEWPPADDSEIFSISLARFSKEKRVAIKKKIIEFVDAVDKRDIDPEQVIMALYTKG